MMMDDHGRRRFESSNSRPWTSFWKAPAMMLLSVLAGVALGVGHHVYYQSLNNTVVRSTEQQQWAVRIVTGLAFLTKTAFTAAVGIAFSQYLWATARKKALSLQSLDAIFAMTSNPLSLFDMGALSNAKLVTIVGLISWLLPLIALVPPAALTVESRATSNTTSVLVPYPQFEPDDEDNFTANRWSDYTGAGFVASASPGLTRLMTAVSSGLAIIPVSAPSANASYTTQFHGPCLKCQYLADALKSPDFEYSEELTRGYDTPSLAELWDEFGGAPLDTWYNSTSYWTSNTIFVATGPTDSKAETGGVDIVCQLRNASYTVDFAFLEGTASTTISKMDLEPVLDYDIGNTIGPSLPKGGRAYLSVFMALQRILKSELGGLYGLSCGGLTGARDPFISTGLIACPEVINAYKASRILSPQQCVDHLNETTSPWMCRSGSLREAIEDLSHNFTLSLLSSASFSTTRSADVQSSFPLNYYHYQPQALAIAYLTGLCVTLACFAIGAWACYTNGSSGTTSFSTILYTTRNLELDGLTKAGLSRVGGRDGLWKSVKLQYRNIHQPDGTIHAAFTSTDPIVPVNDQK